MSKLNVDKLIEKSIKKGELNILSVDTDGMIPKKAGWTVVTQRLVPFTKEWAQHMMQLPRFSFDRKLYPSVVKKYVRDMIEGKFNHEQVLHVTAMIRGNATVYRVNGQHTCMALLACCDELSYDLENILHVHYLCESEEAMRDLYTSTDNTRPRTHTEKLVALLYDRPECQGVAKSDLTLLASGCGMWAEGGETVTFKRLSAEDKAAILLSYPQLIHPVSGVFNAQKKDCKHIRRNAVAAAMFASFSKNRAQAKDFWVAVKTGVGLTSTKDPRLLLKNWLHNVVVESKGDNNKKPVREGDIYNVCLVAWNLFREGKKRATLRIPEKTPAVK